MSYYSKTLNNCPTNIRLPQDGAPFHYYKFVRNLGNVKVGKMKRKLYTTIEQTEGKNTP